jgi:signal transduction histidine kinase
VHNVANAPIFSFDDSFFGQELVGGPMFSVLEGGRQAAAVGIRILNGEKPGDIKTPVIGFAAPKFDWREMRRWGISEASLPAGSEILFRELTLWEQYRSQILVVFGLLLFQAALICWLIYEHRRRRFLEVQSRQAMSELTFMNRIAAAGELSASIAHEVNQPLTGIVTRANAALRWLAADAPNLGQARAALQQIVETGHRAADVIKSVRAMFSKNTEEKTSVDVNRIIRSVLALVYIDLRKQSIESRIDLSDRVPPVFANEVQLQQVILNLVMNAIESMSSIEPRTLSIRSEFTDRGSVHVAIEDAGSGIDPSNLDRIFNPLFTTKARGMGMGLSICRSIVENHGGRIWVVQAAVRGSIFHFEVPTMPGQDNLSEKAARRAD